MWGLTEGFRGTYAAAILALFCSTALNYLTPLIAGATLDAAISGKAPAHALGSQLLAWMGGAGAVRERLWWPAVLMVLVTLIAGFGSFLKTWCSALASDGIVRRLKDRLFGHLQHLPASWHDRAETGDVIQRCTSDVETLRLALSAQVVDISNALLLLLTALPLMAALDLRMTLVSLSLILPIILFGYFYIGKVKHLFRGVDEAEGEVTRRVQENLSGLRVVRAFRRQEFEIDKFAGPNGEYRNRSLRLVRLMSWYWSSSDLIVLLQQGLVLFTGAWLISKGTLTVGTLFSFLMFLNLLLWPVRQMGRTLTDLGKSLVALNRMGEILAVVPEQGPVKPLAPAALSLGHLVVKDLGFDHESGTAALRGISFEVPAGATLAIVGPSGSGKSTLMHLLLRLYDYSAGTIHLDGMELRTLTREWVRAQFSVVMQEPFLFSRSIQENIRLGRNGAAAGEVSEAARMAGIHETIDGFPAGYETLVGEKGVTLSGGQRQRVALARALLQDSPVLLLDDALSAVDAGTEQAILEALRRRHGRRTTLVIAHRLSTLSHADQVIVLEEGRVVQNGTHAELIRREGLYRRLWEMQQGAGDPDPSPQAAYE